MHLRQLSVNSVISHLTTAPSAPSSSVDNTNNVNAIIQVVTTILIIIMAAIFVACSLFFCFHRSFANGYCGVNDDDGIEGGDGRRRRTPGLSRAVIETFPTYLYSDVRVHRLANGELECAVCLNEFKDVEILRLLPTCCHVYHPECIDPWLMSRPTCPVCRADVGSISNLSEFEDFRSILGITSSNEVDAVDIEQSPIVQIRSATPHTITHVTRFQNNYPKSHSTGHSPAWTAGESDRFTLRLPEEVRKRLVATGGRWRSHGTMGLVSSPRSWYRHKNIVGWCTSNGIVARKHNYHRFKTGDILDRLAEPDASFNIVVSCSGSPKSDGPVDYSTLVNGQW